MNIWARRTYFILTILVFIIIAIILVFYASGWRYNSTTNKVGLVGALTVNSEPNNAYVYLNGEKLKKKTPTTSNTIIADEYNLIISKEGFFDWSKDITIEKSKTTRIPFVYLLKKQESLLPLLSYKQISDYLFSPDLNKIIITTPENLEVIDLNTTKILFSKKTDQKLDKFQWNSNSNKIIYFSNTDGYIIIDLQTNEEIIISSLLDSKIDNIYWSNDEENIAYALSNIFFHRINIFQKTVTEIMNGKNIVNYSNNKFFILQADELQVINQDGDKISFINISNNSELDFLKQFDDYIPIINKSNNKAYFYNLSDDTFEAVDETVTNIKWVGNQELLFSNEHEIWSWNKKELKKELILRTSDDISNADWLLNKYYVIYLDENNNINITQSVGPQKNNYSIELKNIKEVVSKYKDNIVYVIADNNVYKLEF